jgi:uncharacterized protein GlcG (DUF336 family)
LSGPNDSDCQVIIAAAVACAHSLDVAVSIAVVDAGGNLKAFARMDGAEIAGPTLALDKAYTAVANQISTAELAVQAAPGGPLFGLHTAAGGRFVIFGGGVPIVVDGVAVGGIGVSGATVDQDVACAQAASTAAQHVKEPSTSKASVVRASMHAYHAQDRELAERIFAADYVFTSPQDDHIDRASYFERCFPTADHFTSHTLLDVVENGADGVFIRYEYELQNGERYRNTEFSTVRDGQLVETEVFFGGRTR